MHKMWTTPMNVNVSCSNVTSGVSLWMKFAIANVEGQEQRPAQCEGRPLPVQNALCVYAKRDGSLSQHIHSRLMLGLRLKSDCETFQDNYGTNAKKRKLCFKRSKMSPEWQRHCSALVAPLFFPFIAAPRPWHFGREMELLFLTKVKWKWN